MVFIGIDPGLTGSISFVDSRGSCAIEDIPTVDMGGNGLVKRKVNGRALAQLVRQNCPAPDDAMVICEAVRAMGGKNNAIQTQFSLGRTLGAIDAVFDVLRFTTTLVEPQAWKRFYGLGNDKGASLEVARALYPSSAHLLKRVKDHNRAESLLIAHYGLAVMS